VGKRETFDVRKDERPETRPGLIRGRHMGDGDGGDVGDRLIWVSAAVAAVASAMVFVRGRSLFFSIGRRRFNRSQG